MSLPYHIGNGWFGGFLPTVSFALVAMTGDIYYGLWYPVIVATMTLVVGTLFLRETRGTEESRSGQPPALPDSVPAGRDGTMELEALRLSLYVALRSVTLSLPLAIVIAYFLSRSRFLGRTVLDAIVHLPLVLPPVVVGYVLLLLFGTRARSARGSNPPSASASPSPPRAPRSPPPS